MSGDRIKGSPAALSRWKPTRSSDEEREQGLVVDTRLGDGVLLIDRDCYEAMRAARGSGKRLPGTDVFEPSGNVHGPVLIPLPRLKRQA